MLALPARHLFVYGTLMRGGRDRLGATQRARLEASSRRLGPATMPGRLLDLGAYPALIAAKAPADIVHGEVVLLVDPASTWLWLDVFEGALPRGNREYFRCQRDATLANGTALRAAVYVYARRALHRRLIANGRAHRAQSPAQR